MQCEDKNKGIYLKTLSNLNNAEKPIKTYAPSTLVKSFTYISVNMNLFFSKLQEPEAKEGTVGRAISLPVKTPACLPLASR